MGVKVRGRELKVNIESELIRFSWNRETWSSEKLIACSPFRNERHPSFAVYLDNGAWIDSGSYDPQWKHGNFIKLMAFLRNETYEDVEDYIISEYATELQDVEDLEVNFNLNMDDGANKAKYLDLAELKPFLYRHPYLESRGIKDKSQRAVKIGYDRKSCAIVIPWFDYKGRLVNYKFRSVEDKRFWYAKHGQRIGNHLYGLHLVYKLDRREKVFIVESEIDALTLWQNGMAALALGGANLSKEQRRLILQAGIKNLVIATDNDKAGELVKRSIVEQLAGYIGLYEIIFPPGRKDINEFTEEELNNIQEKIIRLNLGIGSA